MQYIFQRGKRSERDKAKACTAKMKD